MVKLSLRLKSEAKIHNLDILASTIALALYFGKSHHDKIHLPHLRIHKYFTDFSSLLAKIWQKKKKNIVMVIYG